MYHPQVFTFVKVVECRSFAKAADELFLSRVSVMRQVNALEERIGVQLLVRSSTGIRLTPAGESFYRDAQRIIRESNAAVRKARSIAGPTRHTIRVGTSLLNPCQPLISLWEDLKEEHPEDRLKPVPYSDDHAQVLGLLSTLGKKFDLFLGVNDSADWSSVANFLRLGIKSIECAVPITHPYASRSRLSVSDFSGQQVMMVAEGDSPANARALAILQKECPNIEILNVGKFYDVDVFHDCADRNCLLLSFAMWDGIHPSLVTIPIDWDCAVPYGITYSKTPSPEVSGFIEVLKAYLNT